jgi:dephospho-CoA kinase
MTRRLALAGYMGAGKSTCARFLASRGFTVIDADREAKRIMNGNAGVRAKLRTEFGPGVAGNEVDFARLGTVVFGSYDRLLRLNAIVHAPLLDHLERLIAGVQGDLALDAALLPLWDKTEWFDLLIWVRAPRPVRMERITRRSVLGRMQITKRMDMQQRLMPEPPAPPWKYVMNDGTEEMLRHRLDTLIETACREGMWADRP